MSSGITHLYLSNFRSYQQLDLATSVSPVVLYGHNGAGKTNILEAISLFAPGRGLRGALPSDIQYQPLSENAPWAARIEIDYDFVLATGIDPASESDKRIIKIQGEVIKNQTALSDWLNILWFTPETDRLFLDSPQTRRRFIDRFIYVVDNNHLKRITRYESAVRQRLHILKNGGAAMWLDALEQTIVEEGVAILIARQFLLNALSQQSQNGASDLVPAFVASMGDDLLEPGAPALEIEEQFKLKLFQSRARDTESGMTHIGPHRSDLNLIHLGKQQPATLCSTGEQKILLLSLILAFIDRFSLEASKLTLFLLDDVIAHLDFKHRVLLFEKLCAITSAPGHLMKFQAWMTGTDRDFFEPLKDRAQFFSVHNGSVTLV